MTAVTKTLAIFAVFLCQYCPETSNAWGAGGAKNASANASARIISAGGSITEILFELGLADQIVGVDTSSLYPPAALQLPKVGYLEAWVLKDCYRWTQP